MKPCSITSYHVRQCLFLAIPLLVPSFSGLHDREVSVLRASPFLFATDCFAHSQRGRAGITQGHGNAQSQVNATRGPGYDALALGENAALQVDLNREMVMTPRNGFPARIRRADKDLPPSRVSNTGGTQTWATLNAGIYRARQASVFSHEIGRQEEFLSSLLSRRVARPLSRAPRPLPRRPSSRRAREAGPRRTSWPAPRSGARADSTESRWRGPAHTPPA